MVSSLQADSAVQQVQPVQQNATVAAVAGGATGGLYSRPCSTGAPHHTGGRPIKAGCCTSTSTVKPKRQGKRKAKPADKRFSFEKHRPTRKATPAPWPPAALALPATIEAIEAGRPEPPTVAVDDSQAGRLARLSETVPGVKPSQQSS